ncbi:MAG: hypothetical protein HS111_04625 [Kofleriaceae bacterium]|nr:hypothetical protein [Kofleriaceae bacterium]
MPLVNQRWDSSRVWTLAGSDVDLYTLAVARRLVLGVTPADPNLPWRLDTAVRHLWISLPDALRDLVGLLHVHGRAVPRARCSRGSDSSTRTRFVVPWTGTSSIRLARCSRSRPSGTGPQISPISFRVQPDTTASRVPSRLRSPMNLGAGWQSSRRIDTSLASRTSSALAPMPASAWRSSSISREASRFVAGTSRRPRPTTRCWHSTSRLEPRRLAGSVSGCAYALHYAAYNRYRAGRAGPIERTIARYRESLAHWPDNALFWSRLISAYLIAKLYEGGLRARVHAFERVPPHDEREHLLVARTTDHLLDRRLPLEAAIAWGDHEPDGFMETELRDRLVQAWQGVPRTLWGPRWPRHLSNAAPATVALHGDLFRVEILGASCEARSPSMLSTTRSGAW